MNFIQTSERQKVTMVAEQKQASFFQRIFRTKNPDELLCEAKKSNLKKSLGAFDLTVLGIGAIIGAGIFTLAGTAAVGTEGAPGAGPGLILSFIIAGCACILAALCYAEFASMIPVAGSAYTYTFATLGEIAAWTIGWILMLEYSIGNITVACGWTGYFYEFLKGFSHVLPAWALNPTFWSPPTHHLFGMIPFTISIPSIVIVLAVTALLYKGVQESAKTAAMMVLLKLAVILLFVFAGSFYIKPSNWVPFMPNGFPGVFMGAYLVFFAYIGFDAVSTAAEETKNPQKNLPIGIMSSLLVCTLLYIAVAAVLTGIVPYKTINIHAPVAAAFRLIHLNWAAGLISAGAVAGLTSVLLVMQLGATRVIFAMSRDKLLPSLFSKVHPKFGTPHIATISTGLFVAVGTLFLDLNLAGSLCNIGTLSAFAIVCFSILVLRKIDPNRERPFKVPFSPFVPILGIICCAGLIFYALTQLIITLVLFSVWLLAGLVIYFSYGYRKNAEVANCKVNEQITDSEGKVEETV